MNRLGRTLAALGLIGVACISATLFAGCETRVIRRDGIGSESSHPTQYEPSGSDPLSRKVWGDPDR
ncbi:MAG: hypothetical protein KJZ69_05315 [Phycisphaerales bacterium]|nr:hypothetical protein [Phycisphaerales bacterium]